MWGHVPGRRRVRRGGPCLDTMRWARTGSSRRRVAASPAGAPLRPRRWSRACRARPAADHGEMPMPRGPDPGASGCRRPGAAPGGRVPVPRGCIATESPAPAKVARSSNGTIPGRGYRASACCHGSKAMEGVEEGLARGPRQESPPTPRGLPRSAAPAGPKPPRHSPDCPGRNEAARRTTAVGSDRLPRVGSLGRRRGRAVVILRAGRRVPRPDRQGRRRLGRGRAQARRGRPHRVGPGRVTRRPRGPGGRGRSRAGRGPRRSGGRGAHTE